MTTPISTLGSSQVVGWTDSGLERVAAGVVAPDTGTKGVAGWIQNPAGQSRATTAYSSAASVDFLGDSGTYSTGPVTLISGRNYRIRAVLFVTMGGANTQLQVNFGGTAGGTTVTTMVYFLEGGYLPGMAAGTSYTSLFNYLQQGASNDFCLVVLESIIIGATAGTLTVQVGSGLMSQGTWMVGSNLEVEDIP